MPDREYITPEELVARYKGRISVKTLANWRTKGGGPEYTKIGGKIMYCMTHVINWERMRTYAATAKRSASALSSAVPTVLVHFMGAGIIVA